jgi:hypothetical protein
MATLKEASVSIKKYVRTIVYRGFHLTHVGLVTFTSEHLAIIPLFGDVTEYGDQPTARVRF